MYGELLPLGGGDPIPLLKKKLLVGRREKCDIVLRFANVSAHHCELWFDSGYLFVRDLGSSNGVKINGGVKITTDVRVDPGDELTIAKHAYRVDYSPADLGAVGPPPTENRAAEIMSTSLLARAGLKKAEPGRPARTKTAGRFDVLDDSAGQIKLPGDKL